MSKMADFKWVTHNQKRKSRGTLFGGVHLTLRYTFGELFSSKFYDFSIDKLQLDQVKLEPAQALTDFVFQGHLQL
jgi:hypothetical protein